MAKNVDIVEKVMISNRVKAKNYQPDGDIRDRGSLNPDEWSTVFLRPHGGRTRLRYRHVLAGIEAYAAPRGDLWG
jgi:hypothetical protein